MWLQALSDHFIRCDILEAGAWGTDEMCSTILTQTKLYQDLPSTLRTSATSHQQLRHTDIQELQQKTAGGNTHAAVVGENPIQCHWEERKPVTNV